MTDLLRLFHGASPYEGFDADAFPDDMQGWGSRAPLLREVIERVRPEIIVEVGSWKGASAIFMAETARDLGLDTRILCVDTWLGSPEHHLDEHYGYAILGYGKSLRPLHGYPQLYYTFLANVVRRGLSERIVPLPMTSENAAVVLAARGVRPDMVYVDAAHEEEPALRDYRAYWALMAGRGVLVGDDYIGWKTVTRAARRFSREIGLPLYGIMGKFVISGDPRLEVRRRRDGGIAGRM